MKMFHHLSNYMFLIFCSIIFLFTSVTVFYYHNRKHHDYYPSEISSTSTADSSYLTATPPSISTTRPRIALCLNGNARTFRYPSVHNNILQRVLQPLRETSDVDVFFNIKLSDDRNPRLGLESPVDLRHTRAAMKKFSPVVVHELSESGEEDFVIPEGRRVAADRGTHRNIQRPENCSTNSHQSISKMLWPWRDRHDTAIAPHSLYRGWQCGRLIEAYEREKNITYDYMYRARPDVVFLDSIPTPSELNLSVGQVAINAVQVQWTAPFVKWWASSRDVDSGQVGSGADHFMAAHRADMRVALGAVAAVDQCQFYDAPLDRNPESQQLYWLLTHGLSVKTVDNLWILIREGLGPECFRVRGLDLWGGDWKRRRRARRRAWLGVWGKEKGFIDSDVSLWHQRSAMMRRCETYRESFRWDDEMENA